jgi:4-hydroxymandelate oxidase
MLPRMPWVNLIELEAAARASLPPAIYDYFAGGAGDERTLRTTREAWDRIALRYRVLAGVGTRSLATTLLGRPRPHPLLVAPMAFQRLAHDEGEVATARGAHAAGALPVLSTFSTVAMERVTAASPGAWWFQLYVYKDRAETASLVRRAEAAGCEAIVLTVDAPLIGRRERDIRNGFHLPEPLRAENLLGTGMESVGAVLGGSGLNDYVTRLIDPDISWRDLEWLVGLATVPVVVKGVCLGADARRAVDLGARAVVVSNHGGRQLDTAIPTIDALPAVADAIGGDADVLVDGGVRRGTDVVKALSRGARGVLLGRPILWGLAVGGSSGVQGVIEHLVHETDLAMALCGCRSVGEIGPEVTAG